MELPLYAHPVDVLRKFNPQMNMSTLTSDDYIGSGGDEELIRARLSEVSSAFDSKTGSPQRVLRKGSPGAPETYEVHHSTSRGFTGPIRIDLNNRLVLPIDPTQDDAIEIRTGRENWEDITSDADAYTVASRPGQLRLFRRILQRVPWHDPEDRYLRITYRHGGLGGSRGEGGQTTLSTQAASGATTLDVENAARLPSNGLLLIGNEEYVSLTDVDYGANELTVERGRRLTSDVQHDSGTVVHYCPEALRDGVAAKAAEELLRYEDWVQELADIDGIGAQGKLEDWEATWTSLLSGNSAVRKI